MGRSMSWLAYCQLDVGYLCRSCGRALEARDVTPNLVCIYCGIDCRCPPEGAEAEDPVEHLDHHYRDRGYNRGWVAHELWDVPWKDGGSIGRCPGQFSGKQCTLPRNHGKAHGIFARGGALHRSGGLEWQ